MREMQSPRGIGQQTLTYAGAEYPYLPGAGGDMSRIMGAGGFGQDVSAVFLVERSLFSTIPLSRQIITDNKDAKRYKISTVSVSTDDSHVVLSCVDIAQSL